ncbi:MAG: SHOCT-like domain-containing protein [Anaerolineae bacterium]
MSEFVVFPAEGIHQVIIEEAARDARLWGVEDAAEIQVTYRPADAAPLPAFAPEGELLHLRGALIQRVTAPAAIAVTVKRAAGDLHVRGFAGEVNIETVRGDLRLGNLSGVTRVAHVDGDLRGDDVADLHLSGDCAGDLRFEAGGNLEVEAVAGDVRIAEAGTARLGRVHGDLWAERLAGALEVTRVSGDARLDGIAGTATLRVLHGDLRASNVTGGLIAPQVHGDALVQSVLTGNQEYTLVADGDITLTLQPDSDARLTVRARGRVRSDLQLTPAADGTPTFTATVGQGTGRVNLTGAGDVRISQVGADAARAAADLHGPASPEDLRNLGERIRQQVMASLAAAGIHIEEGMARGPRGSRPGRPTPPPPPPPPPSRAAGRPGPISEEELRILKMVENGTITAAQAEMLLKALEG